MAVDSPRSRRHALPPSVHRLCVGVVEWTQAVTFWIAVSLPWVLLVLVFTGYAFEMPELFGGLLVATVLCSVLGHRHGRTR